MLWYIRFSEVLPLIEFYVEDDISDKEALQLLDLEPIRKPKGDGFRENNAAGIDLKM